MASKSAKSQNVEQIGGDDIYALVGMTSASSSMFERRRRVLREAQHMLSERGISETVAGTEQMPTVGVANVDALIKATEPTAQRHPVMKKRERDNWSRI